MQPTLNLEPDMATKPLSTKTPPRPIRTLWICALAIAVSYLVCSLARTQVAKEPEKVFAIDSLWPSDQFNDS